MEQNHRTIEINTTLELLNFIKRDEVTTEQAKTIINKALNLICLHDYSKNELIEQTEIYIHEFIENHKDEKPIFLGQINLETT